MDWSNSIVTKAGETLFKSVDKGVGMSVVRAEAGTGLYPETSVREKDALLNKKQDITVVEVTEAEEGKRIHLRIENTALAEGYKMQQVGIWVAVDGGEPVLFSVQQDDDGVDIPSKDEIPEFVLDFYVMLEYSGRLSIKVQYDPKALVSMEQLKQVALNTPEILVGPAATIAQLKAPGILFITDDGDPEDYLVTLSDLISEGDKAYAGGEDALDELLTVGRAREMGLRQNSLGTEYTQETLATLAQDIRDICAQAQAGGSYVLNGATSVSNRQVQYFIIHGTLVSHSDTLLEDWPWMRSTDAELAALRVEVSELKAMVGDVNAVLDEALEGN